MKFSFLQLIAYDKCLLPGLRTLPREFLITRGVQFRSKNNCARGASPSIVAGGIPRTSIKHATCSTSSSPGKMGTPVYNSAIMHPKDHMSIGNPQGRPKMTSGARQKRDWMQVYILSSTKHDDPQSITLMPDFVGFFNKIFSGFKSQWTI